MLALRNGSVGSWISEAAEALNAVDDGSVSASYLRLIPCGSLKTGERDPLGDDIRRWGSDTCEKLVRSWPMASLACEGPGTGSAVVGAAAEAEEEALASEVLMDRSTREPRRDGGALAAGTSTQDPRREAGEDGVKEALRVATADMTLDTKAGGFTAPRSKMAVLAMLDAGGRTCRIASNGCRKRLQ